MLNLLFELLWISRILLVLLFFMMVGVLVMV